MTGSDTGRVPTPVAALRELEAYAPPRHPAPVDLVLSGNEGDHPPASLLQSVAGREVEVLRTYPSPQGLEARIAKLLEVRPEQVMVSAGGDEAIDRLCRTYLSPDRRVVMPQPTFVMFPHYARLTGADIVAVPWCEGPYPLDAVCAAVDARTAMVTVVTPNNPSGAIVTREQLAALSAAAPHAVVVVDLAYTEYADDDLTAFALTFPNVVIVRTISKAWGLAGLRVGYAVGPERLIKPLRAAGGPYSVSGVSLVLAEAALDGGEERKTAHVARVRAERAELQAVLHELGLHSPPSQGNFAFVRLPDPTWLRDGLAGLGIAVRIFPGEPELERTARISCPGDADGQKRLCHALRTVLQPQALLFDMDGVLADVSASYRRAIVETAACHGVTVTDDDIAAVKAAGNANNDWEVTLRLVRAAGGDATLEQVTARFEELYQGTPERPGLHRNETLLPDRRLLERWAARMPLGVVTGRPRGDAQRLLEQAGIAELFAAVVCMDDGPVKPDPAPVRLALEQLGVERAWLFGDTPDDVRAARAARVVPIGVVAPGEDLGKATDTLLRAGAARVVEDLQEIEEVMP